MTGPLGPVYRSIDALVAHAQAHLGLDADDAVWARNQVFALYGLDSYGADDVDDADADVAPAGAPGDVDRLVGAFLDAAETAGLIGPGERGSRTDAVMGALSPRPSWVRRRFAETERADGGMAAMRWLYDTCVADTYVKRAQLEANPRFDSHGLTVTINLAKPEFRTQAKAAAGNSVSGGYPKCTICLENEGFAGRDKRTLRTVPVTLGGQEWFWQFSPYGYFDQHGICVNDEHTPMHVDRATFGRLLDFVDRFPGYFLGCNAALPRIGGSVLAHDHYQGGGEILPMAKASARTTLSVPGTPGATVEILDWPGTALRVVSPQREAIVDVCDAIRVAWESYDDPAAGIASHDADGNRQSAVSPTVIRTSCGYEMGLILRNNAVSDDYPEGVFHAHPEYWPIKQEPIGLIEAQGLFILPGRLVGELGRIEDALAQGAGLPEDMGEFRLVWDELTDALDGVRDRDAISAAVRDELGSVCRRILGNTAVFKDGGQTLSFLEGLGFAVA